MTSPQEPQRPLSGAPIGTREWEDDKQSLVELVRQATEWSRIVWGERRFVAKILGLSLLWGLVIILKSPREYTASTKILPYRSAAKGSGLAGLAGLAGVRLPGAAGEQTISADLYPEVTKTLDFRAVVAETPIRFSAFPEPVTPMRYFLELQRPTLVGSVLEKVSQYTIGLPGTILSALRPEEPRDSLSAPAAPSSLLQYERRYLDVLGGLGNRLTTGADRETGIITMVGRMPDQYAAADLVQVASARLMERIIDYEAKKATEQLRFLQEQVTQARARLDRVQREQASLADRTRGTVSAFAQLEAQRLLREYSLALDVYSRFATELENAKLTKAQDTPVFTILERAVVPEKPSSPRPVLIFLVATFLGLGGAIGVVVLRRTIVL